MGTLLLKLAGPLQSWGCDSRFTERKTRHEPTKSGVVGLLAAAFGRRREDSIADLAALPMVMRIDQPGSYERDFQTAHLRKFDKRTGEWVFDKSLPLSQRYYLADAVFVVGIGVPDEQIYAYEDALLHPAFPLYLGRRSCPPSGRVLIKAIHGADPLSALREHPWEATSRRLLSAHRFDATVDCTVVRDSEGEGSGTLIEEAVRDVPHSFSQLRREYGWRTVVYETIPVANPNCIVLKEEHDPMAALEEMM